MGGYGRGELALHSDVDLVFLSRSVPKEAAVRSVLYPLWDAGFTVGHAVRTPRDAVAFARANLHTATALLSARFVAGDPTPFEELLDRRARWLRVHGRALLRRIVGAVRDRHRTAERAGWILAPDVKEDRGGLRDVHALGWIAGITGDAHAPGETETGYGFLCAAREALHSEVPRKTDRLHIELQPAVAARLGLDVDEMMERVHGHARTIERAARGVLGGSGGLLAGPRRSGEVRTPTPQTRVVDGAVVAPGPLDAAGALEVALAHAVTGKPVDPSTEDAAHAALARWRGDWSQAMRTAFVSILRARRCEEALELLDHLGAFPVLLPEWKGVRARAQHDPYHRYTVDGHSFVTVAEVARAGRDDPGAGSALHEAGDPDTVYLAALLHDVGKGSEENHCVAGERLSRDACERMGFPPADVEEVAALVRLHLLLPDTATRRDIDDGAVIAGVAARAASGRRLRLLYVLAAADGHATGPEAWTEWKAALVGALYRKTLLALESGVLPERSETVSRTRDIETYDPGLTGRAAAVLEDLPRSYATSAPVADIAEEVRLLLDPPRPGEIRTSIDRAENGRWLVRVCLPDRPGALARTAGVLTLHRISILAARAFSSASRMALERFVVAAPPHPSWEDLTATLEAAWSGRLALDVALERKAADYRPASSLQPRVSVLPDSSAHSTVIEVRAADALGLLYAASSAIADLGFDIHVAKIDTLGKRVVDVFYVRTPWGTKLDPAQGDAVEKAIVHRINRLLG